VKHTDKCSRSCPVESISWAEWTEIYKLSDMWLLDGMQEKALDRLSKLPKTTGEWLTALEWSSGHNVDRIRTKAIEGLDHKVGGAQRVKLATDHSIGNWFLSGCQELVESYDEISPEDEICLGRRTTSKLFRLRDQYLRHKYGRDPVSNRGKASKRTQKSLPSAKFDTASLIRGVFKDELEAAGFVV
jgi:hypothetical protein